MDEIIISADSHVIEVPDLWGKGMPPFLKELAPKLHAVGACIPSPCWLARQGCMLPHPGAL